MYVNAPLEIDESLLPPVVSYRMLAAGEPVLATKAIAPSWLILLLDMKLILDPAALLVMAPVW